MSTLHDAFLKLGIRSLAHSLDDIIAHATRERMSPREILEHISTLELRERQRRGLERRLVESHIGRFKPIADFDWNWPREIDRAYVEAALRLDFLTEARNIVLVAAQGLGKTMIAQNIAHAAVMAGHRVIFTTAAQLLLDLGGQDSARGLDRRLRHYEKAKLLCVDEVGYLSYDNRNADLLFQLINRRYEKKSVVLTTNLAFSAWPEIFPNAACTTALIDRVIHHADVIKIEGDSYRLRDATQHKSSRKRSHAE